MSPLLCLYALCSSVTKAEHGLTFFHTKLISLLTFNANGYGSVSDLLDYINPSNDTKGKDAATKRKNNATKVFGNKKFVPNFFIGQFYYLSYRSFFLGGNSSKLQFQFLQ